MFEFYRELSPIGKLIFYFAVLVVLCSIMYQCQACSYVPLELRWRGRPHTSAESFEDPSSLSGVFSSYERSGRPRMERTRQRIGSEELRGLQSQLGQLRQRLNTVRKQNPNAFETIKSRRMKRPYDTVKGQRMERRPVRRGASAKLILFYAPWCGHCQRLKPVWKKFEMMINNRLKTLSINGDENRQLLEEYNVDKFPTIILENRNGRKEYDGDLTLEGLKRFVTVEQEREIK